MIDHVMGRDDTAAAHRLIRGQSPNQVLTYVMNELRT
jgi:hypothetical protein